METTIKRTNILDIIANNADVYVARQHKDLFDGQRHVQRNKVVAVLVTPFCEIREIILSTDKMESGAMIYYARPKDIFASVNDLINDNPVCTEISKDYLNEKYGLDRPLYYLDPYNEIKTTPMKERVGHVNLVTDEVTFKFSVENMFLTEEELKASRPDLFSPKTKVRLTKTYELELAEEDAQALVETPEEYGNHYPLDDSDATVSAEIVE